MNSANRHPLPLLTALSEAVQTGNAPFYTPGHKRGKGSAIALQTLLGSQVFRADLPELPELDNLFAPQGAIAAAQDLAAQTFGADRTWFLVNGSTCGIIAAILATCGPGDKILLPRNVHQSAISGLILSGAVPIFLQPEYDPVLDIAHSITPESVAIALKDHPDAKAVLAVYPTYYGTCGDLATIATLTHAAGIPLLVDEAHGAHFSFHPALPMSAIAAGADLTVQSTHKTLSAFTQASMVHVKGTRIDSDRLSRSLQLVQSTSPNYLLLASLDAAGEQMATEGKDLLERTLSLSDQARSRLQAIPDLSVLQPDQAKTPGFCALDRTRLTVTVSKLGIDGFTADEILHQTLGVTAEFPSFHHLTFIFSIGNTQDDVDRLINAFHHLTQQNHPSKTPPHSSLLTPHSSLLTPRDAFFSATETIPTADAIDRIAAELICPYPPGIPILLPGERITASAIDVLQKTLDSGGFISGCSDPTLMTLKVIQ
jgi:arginine/lysine/ornithine decarboxylase